MAADLDFLFLRSRNFETQKERLAFSSKKKGVYGGLHFKSRALTKLFA